MKDEKPFGQDPEQWLLEGKVSKPVFFVSRNIEAGKYLNHPSLIKLYEKSGYVFLYRKN